MGEINYSWQASNIERVIGRLGRRENVFMEKPRRSGKTTFAMQVAEIRAKTSPVLVIVSHPAFSMWETRFARTPVTIKTPGGIIGCMECSEYGTVIFDLPCDLKDNMKMIGDDIIPPVLVLAQSDERKVLISSRL